MADDADQEEAAPEPVIEGLTEDAGDGEEDPELEDMKRRVQEMEEEANKLKAMQQDLAADGDGGEDGEAATEQQQRRGGNGAATTALHRRGKK